MFDKKQKSCVKRIHLVTDDGLYDRKAFYTVKTVFYSSSVMLFYFKGYHIVRLKKCFFTKLFSKKSYIEVKN